MIDNKIHITFLASTLQVGGAENILEDLIRHLDRDRFFVSVLCLKGMGAMGREIHEIGVEVHDRLMMNKRDFRIVIRLTRYLRKSGVDALILLNHDDAMFWGKICGRLAHVAAIIVWVHSEAIAGGGWLVRTINRLSINLVDRIIAISRHHRDGIMSQHANLSPGRLEVIYNGIDMRRFSDLERSRDSLMASLGITGYRFRVGTVARLCPEKSLNVLIHAASRVIDEEEGVVFLIIGDGKERAHLEELAADLNLKEHVRFLGERRDIPEILRCLDIAVLSSREEVFPLFLLEAMASGLPVVSTRVGSIDEIVVDGETGLLVESGDHEALAQSIIRLIRDGDRRFKMGRAGEERARDRFLVESMVEGIEGLIVDLLRHKCPTITDRTCAPDKQTASYGSPPWADKDQ